MEKLSFYNKVKGKETIAVIDEKLLEYFFALDLALGVRFILESRLIEMY